MATETINEPTQAVSNGAPRSRRGEPTWEMTDFYPRQGEWTEAEYLALETNRLVEFTDGVLEFLTMPTLSHQDISDYLYERLKDFVTRNDLGKVRYAPLKVRVAEDKWREPDLVFLNHDQVREAAGRYPLGADLVVEIVSEGKESRERDLDKKPIEYAKAGIREYWIVDPETSVIRVLTLDGEQYKTHGEFQPGQQATSVLFDGFAVPVADVFAAAKSAEE